MWYGFYPDGALGFWTFAKSQKIVNLRRDPRLTGLVEAGDTYPELRGAEIVGTASTSEAPQDLLEIGRSVLTRYAPPGTTVDPADLTDEVVLGLGAKRAAVRIEVEKIVTWDHRKLEGHY